MKHVDHTLIEQFIESNIRDYHELILNKFLKLKLSEVLKRKKPYLFKCKGTGYFRGAC